MSQDTIDISVVIPIYNEEENLPDLVSRVEEALRPSGFTFELICVDDGSKDDSARVLKSLAAQRPWLKPRYLMRNYGQTAALQAGFDAVQGRYTVTLDGDLQNDPLDIPELVRTLETTPDINMISGWRKDRQDAAINRKIPSMIANRIIAKVTGVKLHDYGCALKAYRTDLVQRIRLYGELHRFIPVLAAEAGAKIMEVPVRHHARTKGVSKYGIDRTFRVILDLLLMKFMLRYLHRPLDAHPGPGHLRLPEPTQALRRLHRRPPSAAAGRHSGSHGRAVDRPRPARRNPDPGLSRTPGPGPIPPASAPGKLIPPRRAFSRGPAPKKPGEQRRG